MPHGLPWILESPGERSVKEYHIMPFTIRHCVYTSPAQSPHTVLCGFFAPALLNTVCQIHHGVSFTYCSFHFECAGYSLCSVNAHLSFKTQHKHFFFLLRILFWTSCVIYVPLLSASMMLCADLFLTFTMLTYRAALSFLFVISVHCFICVYCQLNSKGQWWCLMVFDHLYIPTV